MSESMKITPTESIEVFASDDDELLIEATYRPGKPPPRHFHPHQVEHFDVLDGEVEVELAGEKRVYAAGSSFEVPRAAVHTFCCSGLTPARVRWRTVPAGRTLQWFEAISQLQADGRVARNGMPSPLAFAVFLTEYRDVFRLAGPDWILRPALKMLAGIGRRRGYQP